MTYKFLLYEKRGRIAYVTLNRPEVLNAIHPPLGAELEDVWAYCQGSDCLRPS